MRALVLLTAPLLVAGVVATVDALGDRGNSTVLALEERQGPVRVTAEQLATVLREARRTGRDTRARGVVASRCARGDAPGVWRCSVRYRTGATLVYRIVVRPDGSFRGETTDGTRVVTGTVD
ncbi:MAG TPA: hypothetical protein VGW10_11745 [Solirubrobacteraceae bacterium]|nr:hypothetical protein [Solirubrobacteraceae bacterium]